VKTLARGACTRSAARISEILRNLWDGGGNAELTLIETVHIADVSRCL